MYDDFYAHEKLDVFQLAVDLVEQVYRMTDDFPREQEYRLTDQMQRAGISIISNIGAVSASQLASPLSFAHNKVVSHNGQHAVQ